MNFARHVKARSYFRSMQFDLRHWIEESAECDVPTVLTPSPPPWSKIYAYFLTGRLRGWQRLSGDFGR